MRVSTEAHKTNGPAFHVQSGPRCIKTIARMRWDMLNSDEFLFFCKPGISFMADFQGTNDNDTYRQSHETRGFGIPEADVGTINTFGGSDNVTTLNYGTYTINTGNAPDYVSTTTPIIWDDFRTDGPPDSILISSYNVSLGNGDDWLTLKAAQGSFDGGSGVDSLRIYSDWNFYNAFGRYSPIATIPTILLDITGEDEFPGIYVDLANGIARSSGYPSLKIALPPGATDPWSLGGGGLVRF